MRRQWNFHNYMHRGPQSALIPWIFCNSVLSNVLESRGISTQLLIFQAAEAAKYFKI